MNVELNEEGYTLDGKWKLVPVSATEEMQKSWDRYVLDCSFAYSAYNEMIQASPSPEIEENVIYDGLNIKIVSQNVEPELPHQEYKRVGEIEIGGEVLPEFKSEQSPKGKHFCKGCGADLNYLHLDNCPTLKSKL